MTGRLSLQNNGRPRSNRHIKRENRRMRAERWQQIESVFLEALRREAPARARYLDQACADDTALREEVESLIQMHECSDHLLDETVGTMAAELFQEANRESFIGQSISTYKVEREIGRGGMGEVYLARDTRLDRPVAIKLLPSSFSHDPDRVRRFQQEARLASSLNHPNIVTIYEVAESGQFRFIVSEYVEGKTLREVMQAGMKLDQTLDIVIQTASALSAAHGVGIAHRDVKPENIMVRPDGYVKVLDFGLAKLTEQAQRAAGSRQEKAAVAPSELSTKTGVVMGTVKYMSPEQARGQKVDHRTDIFSLGIVLYEAVTGHAPFEGETASHTIVAILEQDPKPIAEYVADAPAQLQAVVDKALGKTRELRYQTMPEMLSQLQELRQELQIQARQAKAVESSRGDESEKARSNSPPVPITAAAAAYTEVRADEPVGKSDSIGEARLTWGAERIKSIIKRYGRSAYFLLIVGTALAGLFLAWRGYKGSRKAKESSNKMAFTRLATNRQVMDAVISPDGKYVATIVADMGKESILVKRISTGTDVEILAPTEAQYSKLSYSPNGDYVYYLKNERSEPSLFRVSALGGTSRRLVDQINSPVTFSPDGKQIAFVRKKKDAAVLMVAGEDGTGEKELAASRGPNLFSTFTDFNNSPAWSPDGEIIACPTISQGDLLMGITEVRVRDGTTKEITTQPWYLIGQVSWLPKGDGLIINAQDQTLPTSSLQIWLLTYPGGEARRLTNDVNYYWRASLTANGEVLLTTQINYVSSIWLSSRGEWGRAEQVESSQGKGTGGIAWTPDGKLVYSSFDSGNQNIWEMEMSGGNVKRLTFIEGTDCEPVVSPDGRAIVFVSYRSGQPHIWRMDADGNHQEQLTFGQYEDWPQISPDGRWIVYHSVESLVDSIWKIPMGGGRPVKLTERVAMHPAISPDGKLIACYSKEESHNSPWELTISPFARDEIVKSFLEPASVSQQGLGLRWVPDGRALTYIVNNGTRSNIWSQPITGGQAKRLTDFKEGKTIAFAWSFDGRYLACVRTTTIIGVVLMEHLN